MKFIKQFIYALYICCAVVVGVNAFAVLKDSSYSTIFAKDEIRYFVNAAYFEYFLAGDWKDPVWHKIDAFDQPPLYKYLFGLMLVNDKIQVQELHRRLADVNDQFYIENLEENIVNNMPAIRYIKIARSYSVLLGMITLTLLVVIMIASSTNIIASLIASLLLVHTPVFSDSMIYAKSESLYIPLLLISLMIYVYALHSHNIFGILIGSIIGGLSTAAKLTGFSFFILLPYLLGVYYYDGRTRWIKALELGFLSIFFGFLGWYILNPTLYDNPIKNTIRYFSFRNEIMRYQANQPEVRQQLTLSFVDKAAYAYCMMIYHKKNVCPEGNATPYPVINFSLLVAGIGYLVYLVYQRNSWAAYTLVTTTTTIFVFILMSPFTWPRYFLPPLMAVFVLQGAGLGGVCVVVEGVLKRNMAFFKKH